MSKWTVRPPGLWTPTVHDVITPRAKPLQNPLCAVEADRAVGCGDRGQLPESRLSKELGEHPDVFVSEGDRRIMRNGPWRIATGATENLGNQPVTIGCRHDANGEGRMKRRDPGQAKHCPDVIAAFTKLPLAHCPQLATVPALV